MEVDSEPEADELAVGEAQLLGEGLCDSEREAHWLAVLAPVLLRVPTICAEAVLR